MRGPASTGIGGKLPVDPAVPAVPACPRLPPEPEVEHAVMGGQLCVIVHVNKLDKQVEQSESASPKFWRQEFSHTERPSSQGQESMQLA
jgi:hypothetical protein